ncbi:EamA family transporter [candidate division TA06 bacterium]|nr:EamA family transporter [candidate division TA06 bacterium]
MTQKPSYFWPVMALGVIGISFGSILIKLSTAQPLAIAFYRLLFSGLLMLPFYFHQPGPKRISPGDLGWIALSALFLSLHFVTWVYSLSFTSVTSSVVLVTINPLFVSILGWVLMREKTGPRILAAIAVVVAGGAIIGGRALAAGGMGNLGNLLALAGALMASGYLLTGRHLRKRLSLVTYTTICYSMTAVILLMASLVAKTPLGGFSRINYLYFALMAIGPQLLGHSIFNWGLKYLPTPRIAMLIIAEPVGATILAFLVLKQMPSIFEMIGAVFIMAGVYISAQEGKGSAVA